MTPFGAEGNQPARPETPPDTPESIETPAARFRRGSRDPKPFKRTGQENTETAGDGGAPDAGEDSGRMASRGGGASVTLTPSRAPGRIRGTNTKRRSRRSCKD